MPDLDFLIHLPLLRIEQDLLPFFAGQLWRMPFAKYDEISLGAFSQQQRQYEATAPVFLSFSVAVPEKGLERRVDEVKGLIEMKTPSSRTAMLDELGLHAVNWAHATLGTPAWSALLLAAPAAALAPPQWSQTFVAIDGGFTIRVGGQPTVGARIQGEADHEYLFLPDAPSEPIPAADVARAAELIEPLQVWEQVPELHAALSGLRATGLPILSRQDRLTIAIQALEALLLPEVRTKLKKTFARRLVALLAADENSAQRLDRLATDLYSLRSESVHGSELPDDSAALEGSLAEQLLAGAIRAIGAMVSSGRTLDMIRARLDEGFDRGSAMPSFSIAPRPVGMASEYRLARRAPSDVFVGLSSMTALDQQVICWSPLLGLTTDGMASGGMLLGEAPAPLLMPLSPKELIDLEERDIRRDFLAAFVMQGHSMALLATAPPPAAVQDAVSSTTLVERMRDLGVVALRLAGYDRFHDPELFGSAVFEGSRRLRRPTALRQTVAEEIRHEATQRVGPADQPRLAELWRDILRYETGRRSPEIEYVISLFRRSFDRDFFEPEQRAAVLISQIEAMLGRFRPLGDRVQLEDLVGALLKPDTDVDWFRAEGRRFRNRVAHGAFTQADGAALDGLSRVVSGIVLELIKTWNGAAQLAHNTRPSDLLIQRATARVGTP